MWKAGFTGSCAHAAWKDWLLVLACMWWFCCNCCCQNLYVIYCLVLFIFTANADLTYDHLGRGLMWSYPVPPRISQMCMTSKHHMYRCTTTWSARTRNCIPFSLTFSTPSHTYTLCSGSQISKHGPCPCILFIYKSLSELIQVWWRSSVTADGTASMGKSHAGVLKCIALLNL